jgi:hypothetical protein
VKESQAVLAGVPEAAPRQSSELRFDAANDTVTLDQ